MSRAAKASHSLKEELELVENYLSIQQIRFNDSFDFVLPDLQSSGMESQEVFVMQVLIHVENAVEHGLRNRKSSSYVHVGCAQEGDIIKIYIEDDGIGREKARKIRSMGTQQGTKMLLELHRIFNRVNSVPIVRKYFDNIFEDEQGYFGTRVEISIPKNYTYELDD